jgi:hypothetical protein
MLVPNLYVFTLKFEIPQQPIKKTIKHENEILLNSFKKSFYLYSMPFFSASPKIFQSKNNFAHENMKKTHNWSQTFFSQVRPGCQNQPRIDFSYYV